MRLRDLFRHRPGPLPPEITLRLSAEVDRLQQVTEELRAVTAKLSQKGGGDEPRTQP